MDSQNTANSEHSASTEGVVRPDTGVEEVLVRRGKISSEQLAAKQEQRRAFRAQVLQAIHLHGVGQTLAWLESGDSEDAEYLRLRLQRACELNEGQGLLQHYLSLDGVQALSWQETIVAALVEISEQSES